ncbi:hypothetical protein WMF27_41185 [Sorangium sp. So ce281]|uniref:hypothetical protein n=1 Tax=unclassified Sorangium TaxID=2621164 RepID=UPI003F63DC20
MSELIGEALLELIRQGLPQRVPTAAELLDWLREAATPPTGVELFSADGAAFTGIVIVDRNRPVFVLAARQAPAPRVYMGPSISPGPPRHDSPYGQRSLFNEDDEPYWRDGHADWPR